MSKENNQLIAEFMGWEWEVKNHYGINIMKNPEGRGYDIKGLKFHSSWSWLMPVVEKIERMCTEEKIFDVRIAGGEVVVLVGDPWKKGQPTTYDFLYMEDGYDENDSKIGAVYKAIVKFIKWYNDEHTG